jgi:DNA gyrase subunit A
MKVDQLIGVNAVRAQDDIFIISRLGKVIRFGAGEVPAKEGVVQGVNCMALRADECVAQAVSPGG